MQFGSWTGIRVQAEFTVSSLQSRHAVAQGQFGNRKKESPLEDNTRGLVINVLISQNHWVSGLCSSSLIKHYVIETCKGVEL
jgi:hypothetical protein